MEDETAGQPDRRRRPSRSPRAEPESEPPTGLLSQVQSWFRIGTGRRSEPESSAEQSDLAPPEPLHAQKARPLADLHFAVPAQLPAAATRRLHSLGGNVVGLDGAPTHCIVPTGITEAELELNELLRSALLRCRADGVVVLQPSWVEAVGSHTSGGGDWSEVSVDDHVAPCRAFLSAAPMAMHEAAAAVSSSHEPPSPVSAGARRGARPARAAGGRGVDPFPAASGPGLNPGRPKWPDRADRSAAPPRRPPGSPPAPSASSKPGPKLSLRDSLGETWTYLRRECPEQLEADLVAGAVRRSLLDFAVQPRKRTSAGEPIAAPDAHLTLGVARGASAAEVRAAYRKKALQMHPDRGGDASSFLALHLAYRELLGGRGKEGVKVRAGKAAGRSSRSGKPGAAAPPSPAAEPRLALPAPRKKTEAEVGDGPL